MIIIFDLDYTLFDQKKFKTSLTNLFLQQGYSKPIFDKTYKKTVALYGLYTPEKHLALLKKEFPNVSTIKLKREISSLLKKSRKFFYPGAVPLLKKLALKNNKLILLTYGDYDWQIAKTKEMRHYFHQIITVKSPNKKIIKLKQLIRSTKSDQIVFIDDQAKIINQVKRSLPKIITIQFLRPQGLYKQKSFLSDFSATTLKEMNAILSGLKKIKTLTGHTTANNYNNILTEAITILKKGGVIVYPTETSYALGADPRSTKALKKIYQLKKRKVGKKLPLIGGSEQIIKDYINIDKEKLKWVSKYWPGPLTIIEMASNKAKQMPTYRFLVQKGKIAIRLSSNKIARDISLKLGTPVISTSANLSGQSPCYSVKDLIKQMKSLQNISLIIDKGTLTKSYPSTIIDVSENNKKIIRKGKAKKLR